MKTSCALVWLCLSLGVALPAAAESPSPLPDAITSANLPTDAELEESWARVILRANPGPYQYLAYEVTTRGPAGVLSHVRGFVGRGDVISRTELVRKHDLRRLFGWLRDQGMLSMPAPPEPPPGKKKAKKVEPFDPVNPHLGPIYSAVPVFDLSVRLAGKECTVLVADPFSQRERRYALLIRTLRQMAVAATGEIAYQPPSGVMGAQGYLVVDSAPSAEVTIDGVPTGESTPVLAWALAPGSHVVTLENKRLGLKRDVKVKIQAGQTSTLELMLQ